MRLRKPVWTEGLFITQHHFQQQDRYHERLVASRIEALSPYHWGLFEVELDQRGLEAGQVRVKRLRGIVPDGTPFVCGEQSGDAPAPRSLDGAFTPQMPVLPVYIGLLHHNETGANVDLEGGGTTTARFTTETARVLDQNSGTHEQGVVWAKPSLRLLLGTEAREAFDSVQIAELTRTSAGAVVVRDNYMPPVLHIGASPFVMAGLRRILSAMTTRQRELALSRRQRTETGVDFAASDAAKFWLLNALNEAIPDFAHLVDQGAAHPEHAYLVLARLYGSLCTFSAEGDPTAIPKFNYLNLAESFEPMMARILAMLKVVIAERYVEIPLQRRNDGMYLGQIEDVTIRAFEYYLAVSGQMPEREVRDGLPRLTKIASWQQIGALLNSAINGARLELEYQPPGALPLKPGLVMFRVQKTPDYWGDIQNTGTIAIYHPPAPGALELALYAVDPKNL